MNEVVIPLKLSGIAALKAELKDLKNQMADAANPEAFAALADKAGDVQKQINKVNGAINEFKKGSNLDQAKASFDAMGESIMKLDFTKAAKQSANLKQTLGSLTPKDLTKGFAGFIVTLKNNFSPRSMSKFLQNRICTVADSFRVADDIGKLR